ncbi:MAG TPA: Clp protease N-terminal domain-containing protein [Mycobacterium sp.]|nr:Clp protease N-terminal domain-containing protein [Mycobacterium sp.]
MERWRRADNFTPAGRRVVAEAHLQAYAHRSDHVGTEHLLLALVAAGHQEVDDILDRLGLSADDLRKRVEEAIGPAQPPRAAHLPYSPLAKQAFAASLQQAQAQNGRLIGVVDLVYGLFSQPAGAAARFVADLGVDPESVCDYAAPEHARLDPPRFSTG